MPKMNKKLVGGKFVCGSRVLVLWDGKWKPARVLGSSRWQADVKVDGYVYLKYAGSPYKNKLDFHRINCDEIRSSFLNGLETIDNA